jgi:hypothetical protein
MSCSIDQDVRIITKYSTISGVEPTIPLSADHNDGTWLPTDLYVGEIFLNSADDLVWIRTDNGIAPLSGSFSATYSFTGDFVPVSGGTFSGCVYIPCLTVGSASITELNTDIITGGLISGTFTGDGSGLTGITTTWDGGTVSNPVYFTNTVDFTNTINLNGPVVGDLNLTGDVEISGGVSASIFYGDGSGLTNLPTGTYSDIYTTAASLSGNNIVFDRNDSLQYSVDLTPILGTQGVATIDWNSATNQLDLTLLNGDVVSTTIDGFDTLTALTSVTAPEFYGGTYYGSFVGTFSGTIENDIYSTTASLVGTDLIIERNDGGTFSADLSSLAGGGGTTPSLSQVLNVGNSTLGNNIILGDDKIINETGSFFTMSVFFTEGTLNLWNESAANREGKLLLRTGASISYLYNRTYTGLNYTEGKLAFSDTTTKLNVFDDSTTAEAYIAQDLSGGTPTQTLLAVDTSGRVSTIFMEGNGYMNIYVDDITNSTNIDIAPTGGFTVTTTNGTGIEYSNDYSATFTNRSLVDKEYVDNKVVGAGVFVTGSGANAIKNLGDGSTISSGAYSFVMGQNSNANGSFGNAFGFGNTASGNYSTLFGRNNTSTLGYTYIMGDGNGGGAYSLTVGATNINTGSYNLVSGLNNNNSANYIGVFGRQNTASDSYGFVAGYLNTAGKSYVFGYNNIVAAPNIYNFAAGTNNTITSNYSATIGNNNTVSTESYGMAFGNGNGVSGLASIAGGQGNDITGNYSYGFGRDNTVTNIYGGALGYGNSVAWTAHAIGHSHTINGITNSNHSMIAGGFNNDIIGAYNFIGAGTVNNIDASYAAIIGGLNNTVNGTNAVILGGQLNTVTNQEGSILGGNNNSITANRSSIIGGRQNVVSQPDGAILGGIYNTVSGANSTIIGGTGSSVSGVNSAIIGGTGLTNNKDNTVMVPNLAVEGGMTLATIGTGTPIKTLGVDASGNIVEALSAESLNDITLPTITDYGNGPTANAFEYDCDLGASQHLDLQGATASVTLTFANQVNGVTYCLLVVQGSGTVGLTFPSGWWLNDTAPFDFTTLADDERAIITASYIYNAWYFAVKKVIYA